MLHNNESVNQLIAEHISPAAWVTFNSLAPGKFEWNFRHVIFKQILVIDQST